MLPNCVQAPPGAGKTTVVPLALLRHNPEYLRGSNNKILVRHRWRGRVCQQRQMRLRWLPRRGQSVHRTCTHKQLPPLLNPTQINS